MKLSISVPFLETDRLWLKEINPDILYHLYTYCSDEVIREFLGLSTMDELEKQKSNFKKGLYTYKTSFKYWLLVDKIQNKIIGWSGFHTWYIDHFRAEIGYIIKDATFLRKGLMSEANKVIVPFGFENMGLNRIEGFTGTKGDSTTASIKILQSLGFKQEGVLREHYFINNVIEDSLCFSLLKRDYYQI